MSELIIYLDGQYVKQSEAKISVFDHGVLYGDGAFEGIRAYNGRVFKLKEHIDRFYESAQTIMIEMPFSREEMESIVLETCRRNSMVNGYIRLVVTRGVGDLGLSPTKCKKPSLFCIASTISLYPAELYEKGITVVTASQRRSPVTVIDPQVKSLNYLNNILAKIEANRAGADEGIMLTLDGTVAECTADNIFIIKDNKVYTPPTSCCILNGITRRTIIELALKNGVELYESEFSLHNVYNADECFLTGTGAECIPVTKVDGRTIGDGVAGPVTQKLLGLFKEFAGSTGETI